MKGNAEWRQLEEYGNLLTISSDGQVFNNKTKRILNGSYTNKGYIGVVLRFNRKRKTILIHRLVAKCFIPNPHNKPCVNHLNFVKDDNRAKNLEWCTFGENNKHARENLSIRRKIGEAHWSSKLTKKDVLKILKLKSSNCAVAKMFGVCHSTIRFIRNGKIWNHVTGFKKPIKVNSK